MFDNYIIGGSESGEAIALQCTMSAIERNPKLKIRGLGDALAQDSRMTKIKKDFTKLSTCEHYVYCAKLFLRLRENLIEKTDGYEVWSEEDYTKLIQTGIMLCDNANNLLRIKSDRAFLTMLKRTVDFLPLAPYPKNTKALVNQYIKEELGKLSVEELPIAGNGAHNIIRDKVGIPFLRDLGCTFVTTEAILEHENKETGEKGLRLDVYGWKEDSRIVGIEIKTKFSDFDKTLHEGRFDRYSRYCSEFYILTTRKEIFRAAKHWWSASKVGAGVILYNIDTRCIEEIKEPKVHRKVITSQMIKKAQEVYLAKVKKIANRTLFGKSSCTPTAATQQLIENLAKEIFVFEKATN